MTFIFHYKEANSQMAAEIAQRTARKGKGKMLTAPLRLIEPLTLSVGESMALNKLMKIILYLMIRTGTREETYFPIAVSKM